MKINNNIDAIRLLTLDDAGEMLQVSTRTLKRMINSGVLPALKVGGQWRLRQVQLHRWLENRETSVREEKISKRTS